jgi:hypothetical protein
MLAGICVLAHAAACAGPGRAAIVESAALHPMNLGEDPFLSAPSGGLEGPKPARDRPADRRGGGAPPAVASGAGGSIATGAAPAGGAVLAASATVPSMVPARGDARSEVVASSVRLLGIAGSFDDRSFLGHILRVNDLLPAGASAPSFPASEELRRARAAGVLRPLDTGRPGDVLFFRCSSGCGATAGDGISAGIVESAGDGSARVVAYVDGVVRRCAAGTVQGKGETRLDGVAGVADPWVLRAPAPTQ